MREVQEDDKGLLKYNTILSIQGAKQASSAGPTDSRCAKKTPSLSPLGLGPPNPSPLHQLLLDLDHPLGRSVIADEPLQPALMGSLPVVSRVRGGGGRGSYVGLSLMRLGWGVGVPVERGGGGDDLEEDDEGDGEGSEKAAD